MKRIEQHTIFDFGSFSHDEAIVDTLPENPIAASDVIDGSNELNKSRAMLQKDCARLWPALFDCYFKLGSDQSHEIENRISSIEYSRESIDQIYRHATRGRVLSPEHYKILQGLGSEPVISLCEMGEDCLAIAEALISKNKRKNQSLPEYAEELKVLVYRQLLLPTLRGKVTDTDKIVLEKILELKIKGLHYLGQELDELD